MVYMFLVPSFVNKIVKKQDMRAFQNSVLKDIKSLPVTHECPISEKQLWEVK
jgi:hypothetical protein